MKRLSKVRSRGNENLCPLPLFAWAAAQPNSSHPRVVNQLSMRFGISPALALAVAELAGLSTEASHG